MLGNDTVKSKRHLRNGILVECKHSKQLNLLSQIQEIDNIPVKIQERSKYTKGVISGVPVDINEEEILEALQNQKVKQAIRMTHPTPPPPPPQKKNEIKINK